VKVISLFPYREASVLLGSVLILEERVNARQHEIEIFQRLVVVAVGSVLQHGTSRQCNEHYARLSVFANV
jgi:hypothetical protein